MTPYFWSLFARLHCWFLKSDLAFNPHKSEAILLSTTLHIKVSPISMSSVLGSNVKLVNQIMCIEATIDGNLKFKIQLKHISKASSFRIRALQHICSSFTENMIIHHTVFFIQSRLQYERNRFVNLWHLLEKNVYQLNSSIFHRSTVHQRIGFCGALLR